MPWRQLSIACGKCRSLKLPVASLDLFLDRDLQAVSECCSIDTYPDSITSQAMAWKSFSIALAGGMENQLETLGQLEQAFALDGRSVRLAPSVKQVHQLRSMSNWQRWCQSESCQALSLRFPEVIDGSQSVALLGGNIDRISDQDKATWVVKPYRSAGGLGIRRYVPGDSLSGLTYLQREIKGVPFGVTFLCTQSQVVSYPPMMSMSFQKDMSFTYQGHVVHRLFPSNAEFF